MTLQAGDCDLLLSCQHEQGSAVQISKLNHTLGRPSATAGTQTLLC